MCRQNKFLSAAIRKIDSSNSDYSVQHRHAAVIVKGGELICKSIHAEMDAISRVKNKDQLKGATIYVARKGRSDKVGMSLPCTMCQRALRKHGLSKAVFTTEHDHGVIYFGNEDE